MQIVQLALLQVHMCYCKWRDLQLQGCHTDRHVVVIAHIQAHGHGYVHSAVIGYWQHTL